MNTMRPHIAILIGLCLPTVILCPAEAYPLLIIIAGALTDSVLSVPLAGCPQLAVHRRRPPDA